MFTLNDLRTMTGGRTGTHDVACPACGPERRLPKNRVREVLRVWLLEDRFATYCCARCGLKGEACGGRGDRRRIHRDDLQRARAEAKKRDIAQIAERLGKARWLWRQRHSVPGTLAERYLREIRGYRGLFPGTLGFLPARGDY